MLKFKWIEMKGDAGMLPPQHGILTPHIKLLHFEACQNHVMFTFCLFSRFSQAITIFFFLNYIYKCFRNTLQIYNCLRNFYLYVLSSTERIFVSDSQLFVKI